MSQEELDEKGRHVRGQSGVDMGWDGEPATLWSLPPADGFGDQPPCSIPIGRKREKEHMHFGNPLRLVGGFI